MSRVPRQPDKARRTQQAGQGRAGRCGTPRTHPPLPVNIGSFHLGDLLGCFVSLSVTPESSKKRVLAPAQVERRAGAGLSQ